MHKPLRYFIVLLLIAMQATAFAQAPEAFNYQSVVRDNAGRPLAEKNISLQFSILSGSETGAAVYVETHRVTTNTNGLVTLAIGKGTVVSGAFTQIDWATNTKFLKVELDANGGSAFSLMGTTQILSVPYALYAAKSQNAELAQKAQTAELATKATTADYAARTWNPRFPDGLEGTSVFLTYGSKYTVPAGKTFYLLSNDIFANMEQRTPVIAGENTVIQIVNKPTGDVNGDGVIDGYDQVENVGVAGVVVPKGVEVITHSLRNGPYTVPAGKTFHLLDFTESGSSIALNGISYESINPELGISGGTVINTAVNTDTPYRYIIHGYLK